MCLHPDVQAAMISEYFSSYSFKADNCKINTALIVSASLLQIETKTPEQIARSVLAKAMNRITGSMTLGAIYVAHLLLGRGDSYLSYKTQIVDFKAYVRWLCPDHAHHLFSTSASDGNVLHTMVVDANSNHVDLMTEVQSYKYRHPALSPLSPIELAMGFILDRHPKTFDRPLSLDPSHPKALTHGHKPRPRPVVPQFIANHPARPDDSAPPAEKEAYAAFALSVFYSNRLVEDLGEPGCTLWEKLQAWQEEKPRGDLDVFALRLLRNAECQAAAREVMSQNAKTLRMTRRQGKKPLQEDVGHESSDEDEGDGHAFKGRNDGLDEEFEMQVGGDPEEDQQQWLQMEDHLDASDQDMPNTVAYALQNFPQVQHADMSTEPSHIEVRIGRTS